MDIRKAWPVIRDLVERSDECVMASVNPDGSAHMTPLGSLVLRDDGTGYYVEKFTTRLPRNVERDERISVYASRFGWGALYGLLLRGKVTRPLCVRLVGRAGERRPLTDEERRAFLGKVRWVSWTRGHDMLWGNLTHAREVVFDEFEPIQLGKLTNGQWRMWGQDGDADPARERWGSVVVGG